ncbi:hypothetical protein B0A49_02469 [Cryomyces minteri]|uniref:Fe2OG dioxygenase domain-containing protein n=1 Tax=Cryomyces minteri TaxID=331657 RepID=A0A4V5NH88_9PEZI|nr:hypothetical protein B0A49_02469 [Cryomyces minteri]
MYDSRSKGDGQPLDAASTGGFVFVKNEAGIPPADIREMFELSRTFFGSPTAVKEECSINSNKSGENRGWLSMHTETLDPAHQERGDFKEAFNIGEYIDNRAQQPLPPPLVPYEDRIGAFFAACHALCNRILRLFAIALEIPSTAGGPSWFAAHHEPSSGPSGSVLRLLYYPSVANHSPDALDIRAGAHSDYGSITLLFQLPGQPGLEILTGEGWRGVPADPAGVIPASGSKDGSSNGVEAGDGEGKGDAGGEALPILVNIGDLLSYWTHGLLRSTVHRVVFPTPPASPSTSLTPRPSASATASPPVSASPLETSSADRYSIAYFCHPLDDARLVPVPSPLVAELARADGEDDQRRPPDGAKTAREHLNERLAATYGAVGKGKGRGEEKGEAV